MHDETSRATSSGSAWAALGAAGTAASAVVLLLYLVGGTVLWIQCSTADLPADAVLAQYPPGSILSIGFRHLFLPALAVAAWQIAAVAAMYFATRRSSAGDVASPRHKPVEWGRFAIEFRKQSLPVRMGLALAAVTSFMVFIGLGLLLGRGYVQSFSGALFFPLGAAAVSVGASLVASDGQRRRKLITGIAAAGALVAGILALLRALDPPPRFDRVQVETSTGVTVTGYFLGAGDGTIRLGARGKLIAIPLEGARRYEVIKAPRQSPRLPTLAERLR